MNYSSLSSLAASIQTNWLLFTVVTAWSLFWKGLALWKASKRDDKWWFVFLLILNTVGILEIAYIYIFSKRSKSKETPST